MITVKLSYSILNAWSHARFEEAIGQYLGKPFPDTPEMELGSLMHNIWEKHIIKTNSLPKELGGDKLVNPKTEVKYQRILPFSKGIQILLRGVPDCTDNDICYEHKCGARSASAYVDDMQLDYYKLLLPHLHEGIYRCYNPYTGDFTTSIKFLTDKVANNALEHIMTYGGELIDYLQTQKLLINYKV